MINSRRILRKLNAGERAYGVTFQLASPDLVEIAGKAGYDYAWLDAEHGSLSLSDLRQMIRAADAVDIDSIVRVPNLDPTFIQRVLDLGAAGIMAPHVRTADDARALVAACRFSPEGVRGACPSIRSVGHISLDWATDSEAANSDVLVLGLIEDVEGVENAEEIASIPGMSGLVFGPFDLSMQMGVPGDVADSVIREQHKRVVNACRNADIEYVTASLTWEFDAFPATGSRIVTATADRAQVFTSFATALSEASELAAS